jgi:hypothetical protein
MSEDRKTQQRAALATLVQAVFHAHRKGAFTDFDLDRVALIYGGLQELSMLINGSEFGIARGQPATGQEAA